MTTKVMSVRRQLDQTRIASSAAMVTVSRTSVASTLVDAEAICVTSWVKRDTIRAVVTSSKYAGGRRRTLANIAPRRSRITLLFTHCVRYPEVKLARPLTRKTATTPSGMRIARSRFLATKSSFTSGPVSFTSAASARPPTIIAAMAAKSAAR